jgi:hypothetical protein
MDSGGVASPYELQVEVVKQALREIAVSEVIGK